jgi:2-amino-4-hydroxy-6-hydroxymethyldihydropteridine diphosphokinase
MIIISLGSNVTSRWGDAATTIRRAFRELERERIYVIRRSDLYATKPLGITDQPTFVNAAAVIRAALPPAALLSVLKKIEAKAGRSVTRRWGPRALDMDILDYQSRIINWPKDGKIGVKNKPFLVLPHPEIQCRAFVLKPLADIAPYWHHPVFGHGAAYFLTRLRHIEEGSILKTVNEPPFQFCE